MTETKVEIARDCALVVTRHKIFPTDVVIRYDDGEGDYDADIDANTARAMIAALVDVFGPAVLPLALGDHDARNVLRLCGDSIKHANITSPAGKAALARFEALPRVEVDGAFPRNTPERIEALVALINECHEIWSEWHDQPLSRAEAEVYVRGCRANDRLRGEA